MGSAPSPPLSVKYMVSRRVSGTYGCWAPPPPLKEKNLSLPTGHIPVYAPGGEPPPITTYYDNNTQFQKRKKADSWIKI